MCVCFGSLSDPQVPKGDKRGIVTWLGHMNKRKMIYFSQVQGVSIHDDHFFLKKAN
jgi:hypothetical protein